MAPLMDWAASTYGDSLKVGKLEADPNPSSRDALQVQGLPALVLFRNGQELARHEGASLRVRSLSLIAHQISFLRALRG